jgi:hypothetical protein
VQRLGRATFGNALGSGAANLAVELAFSRTRLTVRQPPLAVRRWSWT